MTHQTSWLESTGVCGVQQNQAGGALSEQEPFLLCRLTTPKSVLMASSDGQPQDVPPLVVAALNLKTRFNAQVLCRLSSCTATHLMRHSK